MASLWQDEPVRVITWNLWWRHGPWQRRRDAIAATLAELAPDLCGLQEIWGREPGPSSADNLAADLANQLGMHWCWSGRAPRARWQQQHGADLRFGNAVLSKWPITTWSETPLPVLDGQERLALHATVAAPGGRLPFFTTHFSHPAGASATRVAQAHTLASFVAAHTSPDDPYPPVVTGDLNAEPDSDELRLLGGVLTTSAVPGLVLLDAWRFAPDGTPGHTWDHRNLYLAEDPYPDARIDYVLVGPARAGRGRVRGVRLAGDAAVSLPAEAAGAGVWPSDHFAVVADLAD